ncbi:hypothetical protein EDB85DRAFT_1984560, partial [Lactarius pseudohatsudake]
MPPLRHTGLSSPSRFLLLQTYFAVSAAWYIRRSAHVDLYAATDARLFAPAGGKCQEACGCGRASYRVSVTGRAHGEDRAFACGPRYALGDPGLGYFPPLLLPAREGANLSGARTSKDWTGRCSCELPDSLRWSDGTEARQVCGIGTVFHD